MKLSVLVIGSFMASSMNTTQAAILVKELKGLKEYTDFLKINPSITVRAVYPNLTIVDSCPNLADNYCSKLVTESLILTYEE